VPSGIYSSMMSNIPLEVVSGFLLVPMSTDRPTNPLSWFFGNLPQGGAIGGEEIPARNTPPSSHAVDYHTGSLPGAMATCGRLGLGILGFLGRGGGSLIDTCQQLTGRGPMRVSFTQTSVHRATVGAVVGNHSEGALESRVRRGRLFLFLEGTLLQRGCDDYHYRYRIQSTKPKVSYLQTNRCFIAHGWK